jgi:hypothetical protein
MATTSFKIKTVERSITILSKELTSQIKGGLGTDADTSTQTQDMAFPSGGGFWSFVSNRDDFDDEKIRSRTDNGCPSTGYFQWKNRSMN